jgi:hypothetical protein
LETPWFFIQPQGEKLLPAVPQNWYSHVPGTAR